MLRYYGHLDQSVGAGATVQVEIRNKTFNTIILGNFDVTATNTVKVELFNKDGAFILAPDLVPNDIEQIQGAFEGTTTPGYCVLYLGNISLSGNDVVVVTLKNNNAAAQVYQIVSAFNPRHSKYANIIQYVKSTVPINQFNNTIFVAHSNLSVSVDLKFDDYITTLTHLQTACLAPLFNIDEANVLYCGDACLFSYELKASDADVYFIVGRALVQSSNSVNYVKDIIRMAEIKSNMIVNPSMFGYGKADVQKLKTNLAIVANDLQAQD